MTHHRRNSLPFALLCLGLALALAAWVAPGFAQSVTTGSISGQVTSQKDSTPLPGATVTAVHDPTGTRYSTVSRADGRFDLQSVRVGGPYTLKVEMDGFRTQEQGGLNVSLGESLSLDLQLVLAAVEEVVTVTASDPFFNPNRTGAASNVSTESLETLPNLSRSLEEFARTNPLMTVASLDQGPESISVAGRNSRYNNIQIDGAVNNDLFGLADTGTPGGQTTTTPISLDAIQELQLLIAPFDVRQGGFSGGGVNVITRSGTNEYHGSVFGYTRDDSLVGDGIARLGKFGELSEDEYGFRVGGPIRRDKIFFFVNADILEKSQPTGWSIDGAAGQAFANGDAQAAAARFRSILTTKYGFDPGGTGQNTLDTPSDKYFARFDFNLGTAHNLTLRHNYIDATNDINRPSSFTYEWPTETYLISNETNSSVAQLNSMLSSTIFNEARLSFQTIKDRRVGRGGVTFPWIEIESVLPGTSLEFEAGTEAFSTHNSLDQDIIEITDDVTWIMGNHSLTFGTHNELFTFDNLFLQNGYGAYEFTNLDTFNAGVSRRYQYTIVNPGRAPSQKFDVNQLGFYAGDTWAARANLTLTYGLRVDIPLFPDSPSRNPFTEQVYGFRTDELPDGNELWSPRVGFNWDIKGDAQHQLRGGIGIFAGRTPYVWISNNYARTGIEQTLLTAANVSFDPDPFSQPVVGTGSTGEFNLIDPSFEFPQVLRANVAYDTRLPWWGLIGTVEAVLADSQEEINYKDVNLRQTGTLPFDGRPTFGRVSPAVSGAYLITNTSDGEQTNFAVKLEKPYQDGFSGFVSYAYGESKVVNDGTSSRAVSNFQFNEAIDPNNAPESISDYEVEHRFNASASYQFNRASRWPTTVAAFYNHQSGRPFSFIYGFQSPSGGINTDTYFSNDLWYVPSGPDDVIITNGTWEQLDAFIRTDDCLNSHRGSIAPRNCSRAPWTHTFDLHLAQEIPIRKSNLQVTFDILNLMNLIDEDSGVFRYVPFSTLTPTGYQGLDAATGKPRYSLERFVSNPAANPTFDIHNINSRWRAKVGVRWTF